MNHLQSNSQNTLIIDSNLGRIVVFLPMLYFVIGNGDCIKIEKKNWNSKIRLLKVLGEFAKL